MRKVTADKTGRELMDVVIPIIRKLLQVRIFCNLIWAAKATILESEACCGTRMPTLIKCHMHPGVPACGLALLQQWPIHSLLYVSCAMLRHCLPYAQPSTLCHCLGGSQRQQYNAKAGAQTPLLLVQALAQTYSHGKRTIGDLQPGNVMLVQDSVKVVDWSASMAQGQGAPLITTLVSVAGFPAVAMFACSCSSLQYLLCYLYNIT